MAAASVSSTPGLDPTTSAAARAGAVAYLTSRLQPSSSAPAAAAGAGAGAAPFTIPSIDISRSFSGLPADRAAVAAQIHAACTTSGFFTITGHGIPPATQARVLAQAARLLGPGSGELPAARKAALHMQQSRLHRGWEPAAYTSIAGEAETKEGFNWGWEARLWDGCADAGGYVELDGTRCDGANVWPREEELPGFFEGVREYYAATMELARHMMGLFGLALGLGEGYFDDVMTHPGGIGRLLYYPPAKHGEDVREQQIGLGEHSDYECFTILLPSSTPGLEVLSPDGRWTQVEWVDDMLIINIADFLMMWTNDTYKSTVHRVVNRAAEPRYSVPLFFSINYDALVETLPSCISAENPAKYPPIKAGEYILERLNTTTAAGKGSYGNIDVS